MTSLIKYLESHGLPAVAEGTSIRTVNEYIDAQRVFHAEPIVIPATWAAVREFLGY